MARVSEELKLHDGSAAAQDRGDDVDEGGGVPAECRAPVQVPVEGGVVGEADGAELRPFGARSWPRTA